MNYFVDFDHTLYNTNVFANDMLEKLAKYIATACTQSFEEILNNIKSMFKRDGIYDIYDLIKHLSKPSQYDFIEQEAVKVVNSVIFDGAKYLYDDSIPFLKYLKDSGNKIYILSYNESRVYFQTIKIAGSGVLGYVDALISTTSLKGEMPLDFKNSIFIDDKPKDLVSIFNKEPLNIYRIRRPNDKYSDKETNCPIQEFIGLEELQKKLELKDIIKMEE